MNRILAMVLGVVLMAVVVGCESGDSGNSGSVKFVNHSSYDVRVSPNGQDSWLAFVIGPGQDRTVSIGTTVYYIYVPATLVQESHDGGTVTFTDKPQS